MGVSADQILGSRYRLVERLGRGGMGEVWVAHQTDLDREVAVKLLASSTLDDVARRRFEREARLAAKLRSPHVAQIFDYGQHDGHPYLVMERLVGEDLHTRAERGPMSPREVAEVVDGVAAALTEAHELGIVHRDIKPANIFFARAGGRETVKVLDFGIATRKSATGPLTAEGMVVGTPGFMSPEQSRGQEVDHRSDLWSLAVVAYVILTGYDPFEATTDWETLAAIAHRPIPPPSDRVHDLPPTVDDFFHVALRRDPARRLPSATELSEAFARAARGQSIASARATADTVPMETVASPEGSRGPETDVVAVHASGGRPRPPRRRLWPAALASIAAGGALWLGFAPNGSRVVAERGLSFGADRVMQTVLAHFGSSTADGIDQDPPSGKRVKPADPSPDTEAAPSAAPPRPTSPPAPSPAPPATADNEFGI